MGLSCHVHHSYSSEWLTSRPVWRPSPSRKPRPCLNRGILRTRLLFWLFWLCGYSLFQKEIYETTLMHNAANKYDGNLEIFTYGGTIVSDGISPLNNHPWIDQWVDHSADDKSIVYFRHICAPEPFRCQSQECLCLFFCNTDKKSKWVNKSKTDHEVHWKNEACSTLKYVVKKQHRNHKHKNNNLLQHQ